MPHLSNIDERQGGGRVNLFVGMEFTLGYICPAGGEDQGSNAIHSLQKA